MVRKVKKARGKGPKKTSKKTVRKLQRTGTEKASDKKVPKTGTGRRETTAVTAPAATLPVPETRRDTPVFSIRLSSIDGETSIGDLIVVFPRTRDVLMKHGLRFDVEEAGYIYMTLNVFSALHGLALNSLVVELVAASKETPPQSSPQTLPQIAAAPIP